MKCSRLMSAVLLCCASVALHAQSDQGYWRATSKTAMAITGDIAINGERLTMNFRPFTIADIRHLSPAEVSAVFDVAADSNSGGEIYRLNIEGSRRFLHKNTLCGAEATTYMVTAGQGKELQLAFFSGAALPTLSREAVSNTTTLCGTYMYTR